MLKQNMTVNQLYHKLKHPLTFEDICDFLILRYHVVLKCDVNTILLFLEFRRPTLFCYSHKNVYFVENRFQFQILSDANNHTHCKWAIYKKFFDFCSFCFPRTTPLQAIRQTNPRARCRIFFSLFEFLLRKYHQVLSDPRPVSFLFNYLLLLTTLVK